MILFFAETREGQGGGPHAEREICAAEMRTRTAVRRCCDAVSISFGVFERERERKREREREREREMRSWEEEEEEEEA
jgi:hypothetical protein